MAKTSNKQGGSTYAGGGGVGDEYEVTFEDVFSFATMKKTGVLTDKQYEMALRQKKNKDVVIDKFNKSQGIREQYRIKNIKKLDKYAKGGSVKGYRINSKDKNYGEIITPLYFKSNRESKQIIAKYRHLYRDTYQFWDYTGGILFNFNIQASSQNEACEMAINRLKIIYKNGIPNYPYNDIFKVSGYKLTDQNQKEEYTPSFRTGTHIRNITGDGKYHAKKGDLLKFDSNGDGYDFYYLVNENGERVSGIGRLKGQIISALIGEGIIEKPIKKFNKGGSTYAGGGLIVGVGQIDNFMLKKLLSKNKDVLKVLGKEEKDFMKKEDVDVISVSGKNYDFIFTDGKQEFEIINQDRKLKHPLRPARAKIKEYYSSKFKQGGSTYPEEAYHEKVRKFIHNELPCEHHCTSLDEIPKGAFTEKQWEKRNKLVQEYYDLQDAWREEYKSGGEVQNDLFAEYEQQPKELQAITEKYQEKYENGDMDYADTKEFLKEVESIGYTFDYGLDNEPYGLRKKGVKLEELEEWKDEYFKKGGQIGDLSCGGWGINLKWW